mmetsp:Transcript_13529/g.47746  ORF Transcript_13529/g.47746 Transcript_13529/m.47746 type:complete len:388 (-) Transcript_13529:452-1615(-)
MSPPSPRSPRRRSLRARSFPRRASWEHSFRTTGGPPSSRAWRRCRSSTAATSSLSREMRSALGRQKTPVCTAPLPRRRHSLAAACLRPQAAPPRPSSPLPAALARARQRQRRASGRTRPWTSWCSRGPPSNRQCKTRPGCMQWSELPSFSGGCPPRSPRRRSSNSSPPSRRRRGQGARSSSRRGSRPIASGSSSRATAAALPQPRAGLRRRPREATPQAAVAPEAEAEEEGLLPEKRRVEAEEGVAVRGEAAAAARATFWAPPPPPAAELSVLVVDRSAAAAPRRARKRNTWGFVRRGAPREAARGRAERPAARSGAPAGTRAAEASAFPGPRRIPGRRAGRGPRPRPWAVARAAARGRRCWASWRRVSSWASSPCCCEPRSPRPSR